MVTKETLIKDIESTIPQSNKVFKKYGMGHLGTLIAYYSTLDETIKAYGKGSEAGKIIAEINALPGVSSDVL